MVIANLLFFTGILFFLSLPAVRQRSLAQRVLLGLGAGVLFGFYLQFLFGPEHQTTIGTLAWTNVVGSGYVNLLKTIVMPLILVMMIAAIVKMEQIASLGRYGGLVLGILVGTTVIAAMVGVLVATSFGLSAEGLTQGARELERLDVLTERQARDLSITSMLISLLPTNIFADLAGQRSTSIIAVVIFSMLAGIAALRLMEAQPAIADRLRDAVFLAQSWVLELARLIISLTPYGVLALMTKVVAGSNGSDILQLINFVVASYLAIGIMFAVHACLLLVAGVMPADYFRRVSPVLTFAFISRSSAATIPLNLETQVNELKVARPIANMSASFGATIGQNGCAGVYPAMLAAMIAPTLGINPLEPLFLVSLLGIVAISSFGVAGVGGGATFAALMVLPALGFPVTLAALLISVEPLIDMARTALNVNGAMTAGVITQKLLGKTTQEAGEYTASG